jgi:hypothetical protein
MGAAAMPRRELYRSCHYTPFAAGTKVAKRLPRIVFLASLSYDSVHFVARSKTLTIN